MAVLTEAGARWHAAEGLVNTWQGFSQLLMLLLNHNYYLPLHLFLHLV
jgi:hypothetical protein